LQDPEVQADLDWHVRECEQKCSADGRLGSIPQTCARARQQATHEQVEGQGYGSKTGAARRRYDQARWHTCVSRGSSTREQEDREVRRGVGIANQSGSIVSSQGSTTSNSSYPSLIAQPTTATTDHREEYPSGYSSPTTIPWQASSSPTEPRHHRVLLIANPFHRGNSLSACYPPQPRLPQGLL
jgi:hypothetical protein